ncbi:hypothetical protein JMJ35_008380 [Cladonia borealis]|uniref:C2H2-type domain-containing protein n=1 Tax=Cladonia borealis TaxID=184061 RepID=A0AA39V2S0_9LECA|nr:hypothetical protein JMJ35_008380 [Cladonia borealis]
MGSRTTPIDIAASSRHGSPRSAHTSNLTSALQTTSGNEIRPTTAMDMSGQSKGFGAGFGDASSGSGFGSGAQPISVNASNREKPRRESLAGSMVTGMSWGGTSVGSWIRDDIIMQGTSPFAYQSPSFHSSSYLPKLEANFMRDFSCCNITHPTLHELLQHYEEQHTEQMPSLQKQNSNQNNPPPDSKAALAAAAATGIQGQGRAQAPLQNRDTSKQGQATPQRASTPVTPRQSQPAVQYTRGFAPRPSTASQDDDTVGDMEMDDDDFGMSNADIQPAQYPSQNRPRITQPSQFGQPASSRVTPLDMSALNLGNPLQHQGLRNSQPATPVSAGRNGMYHNNPTVSSVNTPTLTTYNNSTHPLQQQQFYTPDSSAPGTPGELDGDFVGNLGSMSMSNLQYMQGQNFGGFGYGGNGNDMLNLCVDEPAKTLWSVNGGFNNPQQPQQQQPSQPTSASQLGDGQYSENSELARTIREQQKLAGVPDPSADGVPKPFHCPVIGCEKAYKNQNGLKYHKAHGHNTQKLHANDNGTYSIVDPDTLTPYPGTVGMEKHKPYRCDNCGKRYKNLNGLKYHKNHSPNCDSEIQNPFPSSSQQKSDQRSQQIPSHADDMAL